MAITKKAIAAQEAKKKAEQEDPKIFMGIYKTGEGWVFSKITVKGKEIVDEHISDPTLRSFVFEQFKIEAVKEYLKEI